VTERAEQLAIAAFVVAVFAVASAIGVALGYVPIRVGIGATLASVIGIAASVWLMRKRS
jgi:hypothetical protein